MEYKLKSSKSGDWITEYCVIGVMYDLDKVPTYQCQWTENLSNAKAIKTIIINHLIARAKYNKEYAAGEADTINERIKTFKIIKRQRRVEITDEEFIKE